MLTLYVPFALLALVIVALVVVWRTGGFSRRRIQRYVPVGLLSRRYVVWFPIPRKQTAPVPVVLAFHGGDGTVEEMEQHSALHTARTAADFAIVYPEGYHGTWNAGRCCGDALQSNINDIKFVRALLDDLETVLKIDRRRIYATGFCNGAMLCYYLACNMSEEIAAIAPVNGSMFVADCKPKRPVPIFHLYGLDDEWAPYEGGQEIASDVLSPVEDGIAFWRSANGAGGEAHDRMFGGHADCVIYMGGPHDARIRVCVIPGLGHHWPGSAITARSAAAAGNFGPLGPPIDRSEVNDAILRFLAGYSLPEPRLRRISIDFDTAPRASPLDPH